MKEPKGKLYPPKTMFLRNDVGNAEADGIIYEMTTDFGSSIPLIHSSKTGNHFSLSWENIIDLAIERGINEPIKDK